MHVNGLDAQVPMAEHDCKMWLQDDRRSSLELHRLWALVKLHASQGPSPSRTGSRTSAAEYLRSRLERVTSCPLAPGHDVCTMIGIVVHTEIPA